MASPAAESMMVLLENAQQALADARKAAQPANVEIGGQQNQQNSMPETQGLQTAIQTLRRNMTALRADLAQYRLRLISNESVGLQHEISNLQEDITKKSTAIAHYTTLLARWQSTLSSLSDFTSTALSRSYRDEALVQEHVNRKRKIPTEHDFAHLDDVEDNPYASGKVEAGLSPIVGLRDSGELGESNVGLHTTLPPQALNADAMFLDLTLDEASGFGGDVLGMTSLDVPVPSSVPADMGEQTSELLNIFSGPQMPSGDSSSLDNFAFTSDLSFDTMPLDSQGPSDGDAFVGLGGNFSWNLSAFGDTGSSAQTEDPEQAQPAQNSTADQTTISEAGDDIFQFIVNDG